jgi:hypothetical protein
MRTLLAVAAALLLAAPCTLAQDADRSSVEDFGLGAGLGELSTDIDRDSTFGAGLGFTVAEDANLRAEYEVVDIDRFDNRHAVWLTAARRF